MGVSAEGVTDALSDGTDSQMVQLPWLSVGTSASTKLLMHAGDVTAAGQDSAPAWEAVQSVQLDRLERIAPNNAWSHRSAQKHHHNPPDEYMRHNSADMAAAFNTP